MAIIDHKVLHEQMATLNLPVLQEALPTLLEKNFNTTRYGDLAKWQTAVAALPDIKASNIILDNSSIVIGDASDCDDSTHEQLRQQLKLLHPWRKGPFDFFSMAIDTEWRSDLKWDRLKNRISSLQNKTVLDVGCGSGYHCWRMRGAGAATVIGIDPTPLFIMQFQAAQKYINDFSVNLIPARLEELPKNILGFDTVFSMGVLYHRRSPFDHLQELLDTLKPGGELILETLVIDGKAGDVLVPEDRYSKMGNIWFIPSPLTLETWLKKMGFVDVHCIDINTTSSEEQRTTEWMNFQSLNDFLDPDDKSKTIEGYPAPKRAIFIAHKP